MKNRVLQARQTRKATPLKERILVLFYQLFCDHEWEVVEPVGPDWDISVGVRIRCRCRLCMKKAEVQNWKIKEVPDELINDRIIYRTSKRRPRYSEGRVEYGE